MTKIKKIAKNASVKNSKIESGNITIKNNVKLEDVHIKAKKVRIENNSNLIGCKIFSNGEVVIGKNCVIKENSIINVFKAITIGARCIIDRNVFVGGMQSEQSEIKIGNDCAILYGAYLNPTKKISLGNNIVIGGFSFIFTHSAWQNVLNGHPNKFGEIIIEDNAWIPWNVIILPGIKIGKNALIGSGSVVTKDVPRNAFVAGNPASIKRSKQMTKPNIKEKNLLVLNILNDFHNYAQDFLKFPNKIKTSNSKENFKNSISTNVKEKYTVVLFKNSKLIYGKTINAIPKNKNSILISFKIPEKVKTIPKSEWIELDSFDAKITSEVGRNFASFIKRYGIRLKI